MAIKQRGNVKWTAFMVGGITFQESCKTDNLRDAKAYQRRRKDEERAKLAEAKKNPVAKVGGLSIDDVTFDMAIERYLNEVGRNRKDYLALIGHFKRIKDYLPTIGLSKDSPLADYTDDHMAKMRSWRQSHYAGQFRPNPPKVKKPITNAAVNRSLTERLREVFAYSKRVLLKRMKHPFPNEPEWNDYLLPEIKERIRFLGVDEQMALMEEIGTDYERVRRFMILTGLRRGNCLLKWSEVNFDLKVMSVIGKGNKRIYKAMSPAVEQLLRECIGDHPVWVFTFVAQLTTQGRVAGQRYPITYGGFGSHWYEARRRAAIKVPSLVQIGDKALTMRLHDHRHTFGTNFQMNNGDIRLTQGAMGHASVTQSQVYSHIMDKKMMAGLINAEQNHYLPGVLPQPLLLPPKKDEDAA